MGNGCSGKSWYFIPSAPFWEWSCCYHWWHWAHYHAKLLAPSNNLTIFQTEQSLWHLCLLCSFGYWRSNYPTTPYFQFSFGMIHRYWIHIETASIHNWCEFWALCPWCSYLMDWASFCHRLLIKYILMTSPLLLVNELLYWFVKSSSLVCIDAEFMPIFAELIFCIVIVKNQILG